MKLPKHKAPHSFLSTVHAPLSFSSSQLLPLLPSSYLFVFGPALRRCEPYFPEESRLEHKTVIGFFSSSNYAL
jgi:hypothetical protein